MPERPFRLHLAVCSLAWSVMLITPVHAQTPTGTVSGRIIDVVRGEPLPGADVSVEDTVLRTSTGPVGHLPALVGAYR